MRSTTTPFKKGKSLENAVRIIEEAILRKSPMYKENSFRIETRKIVIIAGIRHEIDIYVEIDCGGVYTAKFIFECKNWSSPVGKREIIVFADKINMVGAQQGFFVAKKFTRYAEAQAELGEITQGDLDMTINQLRDRVGMPHLKMGSITADPNWPNYGHAISDVLHEIRRERVTELYGEGFRFHDLMRWRAHEYFVGKRFIGTKYTEELRAIDAGMPESDDGFLDPLRYILTGPNSGYGFNPNRDYLMPLPTNELTLNPALGQNPGW